MDSYSNRYNDIKFGLIECANCSSRFENDTDKCTKFKLLDDGDDTFKEISNTEALSYIYGIAMNKLCLNIELHLNMSEDFASNIHLKNVRTSSTENGTFELALCSSCSPILSEMYYVHNQFNKKSSGNSIITKAIKMNISHCKIEETCLEQDIFDPIIPEESSTTAEDNFLVPVNTCWREEGESAEIKTEPETIGQLKDETAFVQSSTCRSDRLILQLERMALPNNNMRCLSCNQTFLNYSEFKKHESAKAKCRGKKRKRTSFLSDMSEKSLFLNSGIKNSTEVRSARHGVTKYNNDEDSEGSNYSDRSYSHFDNDLLDHDSDEQWAESKSKGKPTTSSRLKNQVAKWRGKKSSKGITPPSKLFIAESKTSTEDISPKRSEEAGNGKEANFSYEIIFNAECLQYLKVMEEGSFPCDNCKEGYDIINLMKNQYSKINTQEKINLFCFDCKRLFKNAPCYNSHCRTKHYEKYACCKINETQTNSNREGPSNKQDQQSSDNNSGPFVCKLCDKSFKQFELLSQHSMDIHCIQHPPLYKTDIFQAICREVNISFEKWVNLVDHMTECRGNVSKFMCTICNDGFTTLDGLLCHVSTIHEDNLPQKEKHFCLICFKCFNSRQELNVHTSVTKKEYKTPISITKATCPICNKVFLHKNSLRGHMKVYHREEMNLPPLELLKCPVENCDKSFIFKKDLRVHRENVHEKKEQTVKCKLCSRVFKGTSLTYHMMAAHTGLKPYKCTICDMTFRSTCIRKHHEATHTTERPFPCEICGKTFKREWEMKQHRDILHSNKQHYVCDLCGVTVKRRQHFINHMRDHELKEKGVDSTCKECGKSFQMPSQLKRHIYMYHNASNGPFLCTMCGKKFLCNSHLKRHVNSVHGKEK